MALAKITRITGTAVPVPGDDIDTDRIIPARFMKCVSFDGLGEFFFHDTRIDPTSGKPTNHPLNDPRHKGASIIVSGNNFGCGSSREHAPQSLAKAGFKAVIAEGYAEIFFGNSTNLGIPCVSASHADIARLRTAIEAKPDTEVTIDLEKLQVRFGSDSIPCTMREGNRNALVNGRWDSIGELLEGADAVSALTARLPYFKG